MSVAINTRAAVKSAERTLLLSWVIVAGAVLFSVLTVTPLVMRVTPERWQATAPILPIVVDAAVVIVVRIDSIIARLGGRPGGWSAVLRWLTGAFTLALNVGDSALKGDLVGVGVHMVAPVLLIVTAEASLSYRRAITAAVARIEREEADAHERSRAAHEAAVRAEREEREAARAERERERDRAAQIAREEREHKALMAREEREHAANLARQEAEQRVAIERARIEKEQREAAEREARERAEREREQARIARERQEREAAERAERDRRAAAEQAERDRRAAAEREARERAEREREQLRARLEQTAADTLPEGEARDLIAAALRLGGISQRQMAAATGWSAGWVAMRCKEIRDREPMPGQTSIAA